MKFSISLLIPAYNEEATISKVIEDNLALLNDFVRAKRLLDFEIVVLNDGSTDSTANKLDLFRNHPKIRVLTNNKPSGIVNAFNKLYANIVFDWYMLIPGDNQWNSESTRVMINELLACDVPTGINGVRENKREIYNWYRYSLSELYCKLSDFLLKVYGSDPGSIKLLPKNFAVMRMKSGGLIQQIELLSAAKKTLPGGLKFVPISWSSRVAGQQSGANFGLILGTGYWLIKVLLSRF